MMTTPGVQFNVEGNLHSQPLVNVQRKLSDSDLVDAVGEIGILKNLEVVRYKLLKWPPQEITRLNRGRLAVANLISRRYLSAQEISELSGIDKEEVFTYLIVMRSFGLIDIALEPVLKKSDADFLEASRTTNNGRRGLIQAIRRKLNI